MDNVISNRTRLRKHRFRIASIFVFLALMVYAWFTMESASGSAPDIFPGVFHPVEFTLVITVAFSAMLIGYLSCCTIVLRNGVTLSSGGRFVALTGAAALVWALQTFAGEFVVSEGYAGDSGYRVLYLTFLLPHQIIRLVQDSYYFEFLPEFAVAITILLLLGSASALPKYTNRLPIRILGAIALFYLGFLACGLGTSGSKGNEWLWIVASAAIGIGMTIVAEILTNRLAHSQSTRESIKRYRNSVKDSLLVGIWGFLGAMGWLLVRGWVRWSGYLASPVSLPLVLLIVSVAATTSLVTALIVLGLGKDQQPSTPIPEVQPVLPRRRIILS